VDDHHFPIKKHGFLLQLGILESLQLPPGQQVETLLQRKHGRNPAEMRRKPTNMWIFAHQNGD
jgi:hypothetical protein